MQLLILVKALDFEKRTLDFEKIVLDFLYFKYSIICNDFPLKTYI
jgi:hypothetical protein